MDSYRRPHAEPDYAADAPECEHCGTAIDAEDYWRDGLCPACAEAVPEEERDVKLRRLLDLLGAHLPTGEPWSEEAWGLIEDLTLTAA